jgi:osmotically-inducible protein OsmY
VSQTILLEVPTTPAPHTFFDLDRSEWHARPDTFTGDGKNSPIRRKRHGGTDRGPRAGTHIAIPRGVHALTTAARAGGDKSMNTKRLIPVVVAAGMFGAAAVAPMASAQDTDQATMEQRGAQAKAALKDAWIDGRLEATFLFNEHLNSFDIATDVENGVVRLEGAVESEIERDLAGEIAKSIDGVKGVKNELTVDDSVTRSARRSDAGREAQGFRQAVIDATLTARIKSKLLANGNVSGLSVDVDSSAGNVTLSGTVESEEEKDLIASIAINTEGATSVNNRLMVEADEEAE